MASKLEKRLNKDLKKIMKYAKKLKKQSKFLENLDALLYRNGLSYDDLSDLYFLYSKNKLNIEKNLNAENIKNDYLLDLGAFEDNTKKSKKSFVAGSILGAFTIYFFMDLYQGFEYSLKAYEFLKTWSVLAYDNILNTLDKLLTFFK